MAMSVGGARATGRFVVFALAIGACTARGGAAVVPKHARDLAKQFPALTVTVSGDAPGPVVDGVRTTLDSYLANGVATALRTGRAGPVADAFTADAAIGLTGPDRAALVDEAIPEVKKFTPGVITASVTALGDEVAAARIDETVTAVSGATPVTIHRTADLVLVRDGTVWRIDGYDMTVARDSVDPALTSTSTAANGGAIKP